jgi:hypothetical protein
MKRTNPQSAPGRSDTFRVLLAEVLRLTGRTPKTGGSLSCMKLADLQQATNRMIAEGDHNRTSLRRIYSSFWFIYECLPMIVPSVPLDTWDFCLNDNGPWGRMAIWPDGEMRYGESGLLMNAQVVRFGSRRMRSLEFVAIGQPFTEGPARMQLVVTVRRREFCGRQLLTRAALPRRNGHYQGLKGASPCMRHCGLSDCPSEIARALEVRCQLGAPRSRQGSGTHLPD